ncbi:phosphatase PAP2 family protein [Pedococcus bigeumensis]|uniref:Phosphatase PAP2 family protein n=1 Tax=Pedococcus bigeumensis TaxID=433644 RepID=A0A502CQT1_9MICO|nr:phosphatase PAP2 family protein [Pedococcus bigeumensis]TPG14890.1 phosphatase PAP2 family protein [Pedococcus bigeumensis]
MAFLTRYTDDPSAPTVGGALRDLFLRAVAPAVALWAAIVGVGLLIKGPLGGLPSEESISKDVQGLRSPRWDDVTLVWSHIGNTEIVIGVCVVAVALIWWRTRQWWVAAIPAIAIALQATVFVIATAVVARPRPHVPHLDPAPPTSSYPSGHVGASTALYVSFALLAQRIERTVLRRVVTTLFLVIPVLVAWARLYRGMHHLTDILVGAANGLACALLAWAYLRRKRS